jgi:hypothetical protein
MVKEIQQTMASVKEYPHTMQQHIEIQCALERQVTTSFFHGKF